MKSMEHAPIDFTAIRDRLDRLRRNPIGPKPLSFDQPVAVCDRCRGAGYVGSDYPIDHPDFGKPIPCVCKADEIAAIVATKSQRLMELIGQDIPPLYRRYAVDSFGGDPAVKARMLQWVTQPTNVILYGVNQVGKTTLATAALLASMARGRTGVYFRVAALRRILVAAATARDTGGVTLDTVMTVMEQAGIVLLDDLGAESTTGYVLERFGEIIEIRRAHELPTIITTNCSMAQLAATYGDRMGARLHQNFEVVVVQPWRIPGKDKKS